MPRKKYIRIVPHFDEYIFDWLHETYMLIGGYGSGKSQATAQKIVLKCLEEKRKVCVLRSVMETHRDSTYSLIKKVLQGLDILEDEGIRSSRTRVIARTSPIMFNFPNGSQIIFKGMDNPEKLKSLEGVSIVWLEECSEVTEDGYNEMCGRIRTEESMHFLLTCNPVGYFNWVYQYFFRRTLDDGKFDITCDEKELYEEKIKTIGDTLYIHSTCDDNEFLPKAYIQRLDELKKTDKHLWMVARLGMFGAMGLRVLPQFEIMDCELIEQKVEEIDEKFYRYGMDFGFETSYNCVVCCAIDPNRQFLYIYDGFYKNKMTDDITAIKLVQWDSKIKEKKIKADCAEPKAITYFRQQGFNMVRCRKTAESKSEGSRIANTRKVKRFKRIICSSHLTNAISELQDLSYKKRKDGTLNLGQFNIDSHYLSAIWYALDDYNVSDYKQIKTNTKKGE